MSNSLRNLVSGDKRRYTNDGFNLDLTYITPRLIAMGLPGKGVSALWRNKVEEVALFLDKNHFGRYRIFSLGKSAGDFFKLRNNTAWFGWSAKKSPPLELLNRILLSINDWLSQDPLNVAVIHCKEGRERSGVVIASYLVKSGVFATPKEALDYYATMRSKSQEGVRTPSQIRSVNYTCSIQSMPSPRKLFLRKIVLRPVPDHHQIVPVVEVLNSGVVPSQSLVTIKSPRSFQKLDFEIPIEFTVPIQGDTYIQVFNRLNLLGLKSNLLMFRFGFHTSFVPNRWVLTKADLDGDLAGPLHDDKIRKGFTVEVLFTDGPTDPLPVDPLSVPQYNNQPSLYPQTGAFPQMASMQNANYQQQYAPSANYQMPQTMTGQYTTREISDTTTEEYINPSVPSVESDYVPVQTGSMAWYHPADGASVTTMSAPPPVNRETKDNRQNLNQATDAVARATERLLRVGESKANLNHVNEQPAEKVQL